ncbi:MAG: ISLre2 family transposase, partial [Fuerstiella sp.]
MKVAIFSKRPQGESATPDEWATRTLPGVTSRVAFAAIERSDRFGRRWKQWARRLGILDTSNVTVLADGAQWIREEQQNHLRGASGVLDVFHAIEHLSETSRDVFGAGTDEAS